MIDKEPYSSDWRVIRGRLLGEDYEQVSGYKGCWSERDEWLERQEDKKYDETSS